MLMFSPAPSLTSRIINRYKMREDIKTFNLPGMGCNASLISIDVEQNLFKSYKDANALFYCGKEKSMMFTNCLFRSGGFSLMFTNNRSLKHQALLRLKHLVRTHTGSKDESGYHGFRFTKYLVKAATQGFTINLQVLVPKVLPLREILTYLLAYLLHNLSTKSQKLEVAGGDGVKLNLKTGIEHFCIHPGGRAIIDGNGKSLGLSDYDVWQTSAAGFWYALGYLEAKKRLKKGNRILMSGLGEGFKCNNIVWEVLKDLDDANVWKDCMDSYPPNTLINPFMEKYSWLNDEILNFVRFDFSQLAA
ncbi:hypothetical protein PRUPE_2G103800 [Prunus persica]|uniref:FAE domain-containing protein n=1 Tax=Prunus persica TaxID=3760 RepID=A0A251QDX9_PRUPE|nr:hypothetical protein PRUPE_2G103800 [Prunus persica]